MDNVALNLGFLKIYWYSIFILIGVALASLTIYSELKRQGMKLEEFTDLLFNTVIIGVIGARLYYVIFNFSYYWQNKLEILEIWQGGLAIHGGIIAGILYIIHFCKKRKFNTLKILDTVAIGVILGQAIGRWGNFFNQEAYGPVTTAIALEEELLPQFIINGMNILGEYHVPTFYYESLWNLDGFLILFILLKRNKLKVGQLTGTYFLWYSLGRIYIESLRMDSLMLGSFKVAQLVSILLTIIGLILILRPIITKKYQLYSDKTNLRTEEEGIYQPN